MNRQRLSYGRIALCVAISFAVCAFVPLHAQQAEPAQAPGAPPNGEAHFADGAVMPVQVESMRDGFIVLRSANFVEPVRTPVAGLSKLTFTTAASPDFTHYLSITNGDYFKGRLLGIDDEHVSFESPSMGTLKIRRGVVERIVRRQDAEIIFGGDFATQGLDGWRVVGGEWKVQKGALANVGDIGDENPMNQMSPVLHRIAHPLKADAAFTLDLDVDGGRMPVWHMVLFAQDPEAEEPWGLYFAVHVHAWWLIAFGEEGRLELVRGGKFDIGPDEVHGRLTLGWDPATREVAAWMFGAKATRFKLPDSLAVPKDGFLVLRAHSRQTWDFLRVLRGVHSPDRIDEMLHGVFGEEEAPEATTVILRNKDSLTAQGVRARDGQVFVGMAGKEVPVPQEDVARLLFARAEREVPRLLNGDARVKTADAATTLVPESFDGGRLHGTSDYLGEVSIDGSSLAEIEFNVHE